MKPLEMDKNDENYKIMMKEAMKFNMLIIMISVFIIGIIWLYNFPITVKIFSLGLIIMSLYYQLMAYKHGIGNANMIGMKVQERMINEVGYQATKRGYKILFKYEVVDNDEKVKIRETDMPRHKRKIVKWISILHVLVKPAWGYREFEGEDDINDELDDSWSADN